MSHFRKLLEDSTILTALMNFQCYPLRCLGMSMSSSLEKLLLLELTARSKSKKSQRSAKPVASTTHHPILSSILLITLSASFLRVKPLRKPPNFVFSIQPAVVAHSSLVRTNTSLIGIGTSTLLLG